MNGAKWSAGRYLAKCSADLKNQDWLKERDRDKLSLGSAQHPDGRHHVAATRQIKLRHMGASHMGARK